MHVSKPFVPPSTDSSTLFSSCSSSEFSPSLWPYSIHLYLVLPDFPLFFASWNFSPRFLSFPSFLSAKMYEFIFTFCLITHAAVYFTGRMNAYFSLNCLIYSKFSYTLRLSVYAVTPPLSSGFIVLSLLTVPFHDYASKSHYATKLCFVS